MATTIALAAVDYPTDYATLALVRARLGITVEADTDDDTKIESIITAVSRLIDNYCGRHFYVDSADATRYFTAEYSDLLEPGDLVSVTTLTSDGDGDRTYETTWTVSTDYDLTPFNADDFSEPFTAIETTPAGRYVFPRGVKKGVCIIGKWGWPAVPKPVAEACMLQSERLFKRKDALFGVMGSGDMGQIMAIAKLDSDVELLLRGYVKLRIGGP